MKKRNILFVLVLGLLLSSCNFFDSSTSKSTNSSILLDTSSDGLLTSSSTTHNIYNDRYIYDENHHWKNSIEGQNNKLDFNPHNYIEGKCVDCGYIKVSNEYLVFEAMDDKSYGVKECNKDAMEITIPYFYESKEVLSILDKAFYDCSSLISIVIPINIVSIGARAFSDCKSLKSIYCETENQPNSWNSEWNYLNCPVVWGYIGEKGFYNGLSYAVSIKEENKYITIYGYDESDSKIEIPRTIKKLPVASIANGAFYDCKSLVDVIISTSVTSIGLAAFGRCSSLTEIVIPTNVISIEAYAFSRTFASIYCEREYQPIGWNSDWSYDSRFVVWGYAGEKGIYNGLNYAVSIKEGNKYITITGYDKSNTEIEIPEIIKGIKVTTVADNAFYNCSKLINIIFSNNMTKIGTRAFSNCESLTNIIIPNSVVDIGAGAFEACRSLTSVVISNSLTRIEYHVFSSCISLKNITIPSSVKSIESFAFFYCESLTSIIIPNNVKFIGNGTFYNCTSLTIYCETNDQPSGWESNWNPDNRPVIWGYRDNSNL